MQRRSQQHTRSSAQGFIETEHGVCGEASKDGLRTLLPKQTANQSPSRGEPSESEIRHQPRVARQGTNGAEDLFSEIGPMFGEGMHESPPGIRILTERRLNMTEIAFQCNGCAVVEGMR
jgi:hypothetical protein